MKFNRKTNRILFTLLIFSVLIPKIKLTSDYTFGLDDFIALGFILPLIIYSLNIKERDIKRIRNYFFLIILFGFLSHILGNYIYENTFVIPGEMLQYIKRFVFFLLSYKLVKSIIYYNDIKKLIPIVTIAYSLALFIGLLQLIGIHEFVELYGRSVKQSASALRQGGDFRMIGVAGMTTSWGVLCVFFQIIFSSLVLLSKKNKQLYLLLSITSILFALLAGSRSGLICLIISFLLLIKIYFLEKYDYRITNKKSNKVLKILKLSLFLPVLMFIVFFFGGSRINGILLRVDRSTPFIGSQAIEMNDRYMEITSAIELLNKYPSGYINGLGRLFSKKHTEHIEVEPFYILSVYGIIGIILRFSLLVFIFRRSRIFLKNSRLKIPKFFAMVVYISTPMYFIASLGLTFWHEQVAGTPIWIFIGTCFALNTLSPIKNK